MSDQSSSHPAASTKLLRPALAWTAILGLILIAVLGVLAGAGRILNLVFPLSAAGVGVLLYFRYPILYLGFNWWMWFLTPLLRRLIDIRIGYSDPSLILLAPYLVSLFTTLTVGRHLPKSHRNGSLPFILALIGVAYGFLIAFVNRPVSTAVIALLDWLTPITFGFHILVNWHHYPSYRQNTQRVFVWGVLVMGVYGIYQYIVAPPWDLFWLVQSGMYVTNGGTPGPYALRIWSTLHSVEPFAAYMAAGLLLLLNRSGVLNITASVAGYAAFLLSLARSAWLGWVAGLITLAGSLKPNLQMRLFISITLIGLLVLPLSTLEPFSERIGTRVGSLSNVQEDGSAQVRQEIYQNNFVTGLTRPLGDGIGGDGYDSAILNILRNTGWIGTLFYTSGILLATWQLFQSSITRSDMFASATRAIVISCLVRLPVNNPMIGESGMIFWGFMGMSIAASLYHHYQQQTEQKLEQ